MSPVVRLLDCEEDMYAFAEVQKRMLTEKERPRLRLHAKPAERRTRARAPRRVKK